MRAAGEGVVEREDVAGFGVAVEHCVDGLRHRSEVDGDVFGLCDDRTVGVEQRRRAVPPLGDVRGVRAAYQDVAHLLRDAFELVPQDFERYGVEFVTPGAYVLESS